ncbi:MAG: hypothetical protein D6788_11890, partial [Planctomycetota bacterium]
MEDHAPPQTPAVSPPPSVTYRFSPGTGVSASTALAVLTAVWAVLLVSVGTWATYHAPHREDQYQLILLGQQIRDGGRMYVDAWENKPPGLAWLHAGLLTIDPRHGLLPWLFPGVVTLLGLLLFGWACARTLGGAAACGATALAAVVWTLRIYDTPTIHPDFYSASLEWMGISVFLLALCAERRWRRAAGALAAGLLFAAALTVKQTALLAPAILLGPVPHTHLRAHET